MQTYDSKNLTDTLRSAADTLARAVYSWANRLDRMFAHHGLDRYFAHGIRLQKTSPVAFRHPTQELDVPFRTSNSHVLRLPLTHHGIVLGRWSKAGHDEAETLLAAVRPTRAADDKELLNYDADTAIRLPEDGMDPVARLRSQVGGGELRDDRRGDGGPGNVRPDDRLAGDLDGWVVS